MIRNRPIPDPEKTSKPNHLNESLSGYVLSKINSWMVPLQIFQATFLWKTLMPCTWVNLHVDGCKNAPQPRHHKNRPFASESDPHVKMAVIRHCLCELWRVRVMWSRCDVTTCAYQVYGMFGIEFMGRLISGGFFAWVALQRIWPSYGCTTCALGGSQNP